MLLLGCRKTEGPRVPTELGTTRDVAEPSDRDADTQTAKDAASRVTLGSAVATPVSADAPRWGVYLERQRLPRVFGAALPPDWEAVLAEGGEAEATTSPSDGPGDGRSDGPKADPSDGPNGAGRNAAASPGQPGTGKRAAALPAARALLAADEARDGDLDVFLAVETSDGWALLGALREGPHFAPWVVRAEVRAPTAGCGAAGPASLFEWAGSVWLTATFKCGEGLWSQALRVSLDGAQTPRQAGARSSVTGSWTWETRTSSAPLRLCLSGAESDTSALALCPGDAREPSLALATLALAEAGGSAPGANASAAEAGSAPDPTEPLSVTRARLLRAACHIDDRWVVSDVQGQPVLCPSREALTEALLAGAAAATDAGLMAAALDLSETLEGLALPEASTAARFEALAAAARRVALKQVAVLPLEPFTAPTGVRRSRLRFVSETLLAVTGNAESAAATHYIDVNTGPVTAAADRSLRYRQPLLERVLMRVFAECGAPHFEWVPSDTLLGEAFTADSGRVTALPSPWHSHCRRAPGIREFAHVLEWENSTLWLLTGGQVVGYDMSSEHDPWAGGDAVHVRPAQPSQSWLRRTPYGLVRYAVDAEGELQRRLLPLPSAAGATGASNERALPDVALSPSGQRWAFIAGNHVHVYDSVPDP